MRSFVPSRSRSRSRIRCAAFVPLALASLAALLSGCHPTPPTAAAPPPAQVTVAPVEQRDWMEWEELTGRTAPVEFVEVRPRVSGHIEEVRFQSGQLVKKGDVLVRLDARWHKADLERREADLAAAKIRAENAEREAARNPQLLASKALSREEADTREARRAETAAALLAAKAARDSAQLDFDHTEVRSPIDGRASRALVTVGNYVSGVAGVGALLTTIVSIDPIYVYADLDERALLRYNALLRDGKLSRTTEGHVPVELQLSDETGFLHQGRVDSLDNRVDPTSGTIVLRALFPNPDGRIVPGLFARLRLPAGTKSPTLLIEETAIGTDQAQKFALVLSSSNTAAYRPVTLGPRVDHKRVVRSGLQAGDKVIVNGLARIRPGMPVVAESANASAPAAKP